MITHQPEWSALIGRQLALLAGADAGGINAAAVMTGFAGAATAAAAREVGDEALRAELTAVGRRILQLPEPKR